MIENKFEMEDPEQLKIFAVEWKVKCKKVNCWLIEMYPKLDDLLTEECTSWI